MSLEQFKKQNGEHFWEVAVKCAQSSTEKVMKRVVGRGNLWCSVDNEEVCDENKFTLSRALCSSSNVADTQIVQRRNSDELGSSAASLGGADSKALGAETTTSPNKANSSNIEASSGSRNSSNQPTTSTTGLLVAKDSVSQSVVAKLNVTTRSRKNALLREQVQIEEQRIQIEQRRLQLVQIELDLKKQQLN